jgi:hypothetical protein
VRAWICSIFIAVLCGFLPRTSWGSFVASPMEHHLEVRAGETGATVVTIKNTGQRSLTLKLYLCDSEYSPDWQEADRPAASLERSCASWIRLEEGLLEIGPGEVRRVALGMDVPGSAGGSYWTKLYIEEISTPEGVRRQMAGRTYRVFMKQRMGIRIWEDVPGTAIRDALVSEVAVRPGEAAGSRSIGVRVENAGNAVLRCQGRVELRTSAGAVAETLSLGSKGEFLLFPGGRRNLAAASALRLPPGTYTALAVVDFGGDHLVAGEDVFRIDGEGDLTQRKEP